jgi:hypothetical protein
MRSRLTLLALVVAFISAMALVPSTATAQQGAVPVTGTLSNGETFRGVLRGAQFVVNDGQLFLNAVLTGTAIDVNGVRQQLNETLTLVNVDLIDLTPGVCDVLFLDIGPIFLDVLGLTVDLSEIVLDINAVSGPGNLLGNLLCALVGLLNP